MPTGIDAFKRKQAAKEQRKAQFGGDRPNVDYFGIQANQYAIVRFLEQGDDITFADVHRVPIEGQRYPMDFICLDSNEDGTPCPACQSDNDEVRKRFTKGFFNVIWRDGPLYKKNDKGWIEKDANTKKPIIIGRQDGIFLWKCSNAVLQMLIEKDSRFKGLMSRDWDIRRTGSGMQDTKYFCEPADPDAGPQPMMLPDLALSEKKYDLKELTRPLSFMEFATILNSGSLPNGPQPTMDRSAVVPTAETTFNGGEPVRSSAFTRG